MSVQVPYQGVNITARKLAYLQLAGGLFGPLFGKAEELMSEGRARTKSQAEKLANEMGLIPFFPKDDELFLDFDDKFETVIIRKQAEISCGSASGVLQFTGGIKFISQLWTRSRSGNAHLYIKVSEPLDMEMRIGMQAILGSDPTREAYNIIRWRESSHKLEPYAQALFETPDQAELVKQWRNPAFSAKERLRKLREIMNADEKNQLQLEEAEIPF